jgi:lysozyme
VADLELGGNCQRRPTPAELHQEVEAWSAMVRAHFGREPIFYLTREMYELYFRDYPLSGRVWIRDVFREPAQRDPKWAIWQYANRGRVEGVEGPVDLNVFCCDRSAWERFR